MKEDTLSRLMKTSNKETSTFTLDEQLEDIDDDFMGAMSDESKNKMFDTIKKMEYREDESEDNEFSVNPEEEEEDTQLPEMEEEEEEIPQYTEPKRGRGRPRKIEFDQSVQQQSQPVKQQYSEPIREEQPRVYSNSNSMDLSSFMDSLAKDLIEELRVSNYSTRNFSHSQMLTILNYIEQKI